MKRSRGENLFNVCNICFLIGVVIVSLYPFIYTLTISLSTAAEANRASLHLYPREISLAAYRMVLTSPEIATGYVNTLLRTILGTCLTLLLTCMCAYPLSRPHMPHRRLITFLVLFTMIFDGGLVPSYLLIKNLNLINTIWALVLPMAVTAFNVIIVKNFFQQIPVSLYEAARMDGAGEFTILFRIFIPLSKPVLATVALWTGVLHWNQWFDAMLYITDDRRQVLQIFLQRIVIEGGTAMIDMGVTDVSILDYTPDTIKAATVIVTILPIIFFYPMVQKYFVKGIMLGGVKG